MLHISVVVPALLRLEGLAVKEMMTGGVVGVAGAATVTVTDLVAVPPGPLAVKVKVVVNGGRMVA
ncbi:MAG: hypothetical protein FJ024_09550 [Chloroflexi bacterium]|nr:hypothetical protein [Chloroflexota bacterium]